MKPKPSFCCSSACCSLSAGRIYLPIRKSQRRSVPKDFSYPEASQIVEINASAKSLSGVVQTPGGGGLPDALVERVDSDWKQRLDATFTDSEGRFVLPNVPVGNII
jgi:hypothetical protein